MAVDPLILIVCRGFEHLSLKLRALAVALGRVRANANAKPRTNDFFIRIPDEHLLIHLPSQEYPSAVVCK
jgi:hypothetical protein